MAETRSPPWAVIAGGAPAWGGGRSQAARAQALTRRRADGLALRVLMAVDSGSRKPPRGGGLGADFTPRGPLGADARGPAPGDAGVRHAVARLKAMLAGSGADPAGGPLDRRSLPSGTMATLDCAGCHGNRGPHRTLFGRVTGPGSIPPSPPRR